MITKEELQMKIDIVHEIYDKRGITEEEQDIIWEAIASFCAYQLHIQKGPFCDFLQKINN